MAAPNNIIGRRISKIFDGVIYMGTVVSGPQNLLEKSKGAEYIAPCWRVVYDDGDREDMELFELEEAFQIGEKNVGEAEVQVLAAAERKFDSDRMEGNEELREAAIQVRRNHQGRRAELEVAAMKAAGVNGGQDIAEELDEQVEVLANVIAAPDVVHGNGEAVEQAAKTMQEAVGEVDSKQLRLEVPAVELVAAELEPNEAMQEAVEEVENKRVRVEAPEVELVVAELEPNEA